MLVKHTKHAYIPKTQIHAMQMPQAAIHIDAATIAILYAAETIDVPKGGSNGADANLDQLPVPQHKASTW